MDQPQYVRCSVNPDHVYPAYLPECDVCALMRLNQMRAQGQIPLGANPYSPPQPAVNPLYGTAYNGTGFTTNPMDQSDDMPSDEMQLSRYGIPLAVAAGIFILIVLFANVRPAPAKSVAGAPDQGSSIVAQDTPVTRPITASSPIQQVQQALGFAPSPAPATTSSDSAPPGPDTYTPVALAPTGRYYSNKDLVGTWVESNPQSGEDLASYKVAIVKGEIKVKGSQLLDNRDLGDFSDSNYDGVHWIIQGDAKSGAPSFNLVWQDGNTFAGSRVSPGKKPQYTVWRKHRDLAQAVSQ